SAVEPGRGAPRRLKAVLRLVARRVITAAFGRRCIPPRGVARRSNTPGIVPPRALRGGRLGALGASPQLRDGPLSSITIWKSMPRPSVSQVRERLATGFTLDHLWRETMGLPKGDSKERALAM